MTYTTSALFVLSQKRYTDVSAFPGTSNFTVMLDQTSADFNTFFDVTSDIASTSDATTESYTCQAAMNTYLTAKLDWVEKTANIAPQNRGDIPEPDLFDSTVAMIALRKKLGKLKADDKPRCSIVNMYDGSRMRFT